jgi:pantetheine hydrolase
MQTAPSNLDIIVFPEMTLNSMATAVEIPEVDEKLSPCDSDKFQAGNSMKQISCAAKTHQRYVVVNMVTKAKCPDPEMIANKDPRNCSARADGFSYYNTNIVFDRKGTLISRYRKFNLFGEQVDKPLKPALVSFDTDFGVKFGHFICFDLAFRYPALELVRANISDIIFPTMWFSEAPFLTAVQVQQNWAFTNNVNLLAAGANFPDVGSTGTGIYARRKGSIKSVMEGANRTTLYTASVPKKGLGDNIDVVDEAVKYTKVEMASLYLKKDVFDRYTIEFHRFSA